MSLLSRENNPMASQKPKHYVLLFPGISSGNNRVMNSTATIRRGYLFAAGSSFIGIPIRRMAVLLRKSSGSPTGNITFTIRDSGDTIINTLATFDSAAISAAAAGYRWVYAEFGPALIPSGGRVQVEYSSGDGSNNIAFGRVTSTTNPAFVSDTDFVASYTNTATTKPCMMLWT